MIYDNAESVFISESEREAVKQNAYRRGLRVAKARAVLHGTISVNLRVHIPSRRQGKFSLIGAVVVLLFVVLAGWYRWV